MVGRPLNHSMRPLTTTCSPTGIAFSSQARMGMEEGQRDLAGVVMGIDAVGHGSVAARRRLVAVDAHVERDDGACRRERDARAGCGGRSPCAAARTRGRQRAPGGRQIGRDDLLDQRADLRPDAGKRGDRDKQRIEHGGAHDVSLCRDGRSARLTPPSIHAICAARDVGCGTMTGTTRSSDGLEPAAASCCSAPGIAACARWT